VLTFDPPGNFSSTRHPKVDMQEMFDCTKEVLDHFEIADNIDIVGHSMGSFCALAFAIHYPVQVKKLVLIGSTSGWRAVSKWGIHKNWRWYKDKEFWQCIYWGSRIFLGIDNLKIHKQLDNLVENVSFVDKKHVKLVQINPDDHKKPAPRRSKWMTHLRKNKIDYNERLNEIESPVLICVGKFDPQTPVIMNQEVHDGIKNSRLIIFNNSGHSPFIEEREYFTEQIKQFLECE
jgi:proline iminopeptidase